MDLSPRLRSRLAGIAPWSGLIAAGLAWGLHHQVVTDGLHFDCRATADGTAIAVGVVALLIVVAGAFASWRALPGTDPDSEPLSLRRFIVHVSLMAGLLAMFGLGLNLLASALLPGCPPT
jgi:hypothetical protein